MKKNLLALALLLFVFGCKKSDNTKKEEEQSFKGCVIESITSKGSYGDETSNYTYDDEGRVIKETHNSINYAGNLVRFNYTYEYLEKRINLYYEYTESGRTTSHIGYYELDDKGRIIKRIDEGVVEEEYEYDNNGYLIGVTDGVYKPLIYENGNLIRSGTNYPYTADNYYTSEPLLQGEFDFARLDLLDEGYVVLHNYFGKASKNLIKSRRRDYGPSSGTTTYSFTKNEKGNITRMVETTGTAPNTSTKTTNYTYKCF